MGRRVASRIGSLLVGIAALLTLALPSPASADAVWTGGLGTSLGEESETSICKSGTLMVGIEGGLQNVFGNLVVGRAAARCNDGSTEPAIGNAADTGTTGQSDCPAAFVTTGFSGRGGDLVDAVRVHCQARDASGSPSGPVTVGPTFGGGGGSESGPLDCPDGYVARGMDGTVRVGVFRLMDFVRLVCSAPDTTITSGPEEGSTTTETTATFEFESDEPGATFECRVDDGPFEACESGHTTGELALGEHTFEVRSVDLAGVPDPTPDSRTWTVEGPPPPPASSCVLVKVTLKLLGRPIQVCV